MAATMTLSCSSNNPKDSRNKRIRLHLVDKEDKKEERELVVVVRGEEKGGVV
jgi:hypothetical protein